MELRKKFAGFWPLFISTHLHPWTRRFHAFGNSLMAAMFLTFALTGHWLFFGLAFLGYVPSWIGHFVFEKNVPVTIKSPYLSAFSDLKMIGLMASGELDDELLRLFGTKTPAVGAPILVSPEDEQIYQEKLRYRIRAEIDAHPFTNYWDIFLLKHQRPLNIWIHVLAMIYLYALIAYVFVSGHWAYLVLIPLSQIAGLISHATFERNHIDFEDALFSPRAFLCLNRMMLLVLTGRYGAEARRAKAAFDQSRALSTQG
jgi:hypothetical protein